MSPTSQQRGPANFTQADGITLKEYVDLRFDQAQMALELAKKANEVHFDQLNKFREALQDQTNAYVTRHELELKLERWISEYKTARVPAPPPSRGRPAGSPDPDVHRACSPA